MRDVDRSSAHPFSFWLSLVRLQRIARYLSWHGRSVNEKDGGNTGIGRYRAWQIATARCQAPRDSCWYTLISSCVTWLV